MNERVRDLIDQAIGKQCCRTRVGHFRSLSLGFGNKVFHGKPHKVDSFYGEWEMGTFHGDWRIVRAGKIICGSRGIDDIGQLDQAVKQIDFGRFLSLRQLTPIDVRVELDDNLSVDFLATMPDAESFHIYCPGNIYVRLSDKGGWQVGPSDKPWKPEE